MADGEKCCGNCRFARTDQEDDWICVNDNSDYCSDFIDYLHECQDWEGRDYDQMFFDYCKHSNLSADANWCRSSKRFQRKKQWIFLVGNFDIDFCI